MHFFLVARMIVVYWALNPWVAGPNPVGLTNEIKGVRFETFQPSMFSAHQRVGPHDLKVIFSPFFLRVTWSLWYHCMLSLLR